jgi:hypothetical protein
MEHISNALTRTASETMDDEHPLAYPRIVVRNQQFVPPHQNAKPSATSTRMLAGDDGGADVVAEQQQQASKKKKVKRVKEGNADADGMYLQATTDDDIGATTDDCVEVPQPQQDEKPRKKKKAVVTEEEQQTSSAVPNPQQFSMTQTGGGQSWGGGGAGMGMMEGGTPFRTEYAKNDLRNRECAEGLFSTSLAALQTAPLERSYPADNPAYKDIRIRPFGVKVEVQKMIESRDGERKWVTVAYGFVRHGVEMNAFSMTADVLSSRDYFVAKVYQDYPNGAVDPVTGARSRPIMMPKGMFTYDVSGPQKPSAQALGLSSKPKSGAASKKDTSKKE